MNFDKLILSKIIAKAESLLLKSSIEPIAIAKITSIALASQVGWLLHLRRKWGGRPPHYRRKGHSHTLGEWRSL